MSKLHLDKNFLKTIKSMAKVFKHSLICTGCPLAPLIRSYPNMSCRQITVSISNYSIKPITMEGLKRTIDYNNEKRISQAVLQ